MSADNVIRPPFRARRSVHVRARASLAVIAHCLRECAARVEEAKDKEGPAQLAAVIDAMITLAEGAKDLGKLRAELMSVINGREIA